MSADEVRRVELAKQIFDQIMSFDADSNGFIDASEFKAYLKAVGQWGTDELYTEERWEESWPTVCELLEVEGVHIDVDPEVGIPMDSFIKYSEMYRKEKLDADLATLGSMDASQMSTLATEEAEVEQGSAPDPLQQAEAEAAMVSDADAEAMAAAKAEAKAAAQAEKAARQQARADANAAKAAEQQTAQEPELELDLHLPELHVPGSPPPERPPQTPVVFDEGNNEFRMSGPIDLPDLDDDDNNMKNHPADPEWGVIKYPKIQARTARVLRAVSGSIDKQAQRSAAHNWGHWHDHWLEVGLDEVYSMVVEMPEMHGFELVGMAGQSLEDIEHERKKCAETGDEKNALRLAEAAILLMCETVSSDARIARRLCALVARLNAQAVAVMEGGPAGHSESKQYLTKALAITAKPMSLVLSNREERLRLRSTTLNNLGCLFRRMGKVHAALKHLEMALEIEATLSETPESAGTHLNLCAILLQLKEPRVALKHARAALDKLLRRLNLGDSSQMETDDALAGKLTAEELPHARSLAIGYENLSCCHESNGAIAKAMAAHDRAVAIAETHFTGDPITLSIEVRGPHLRQLLQAQQTQHHLSAHANKDTGTHSGTRQSTRRVSPRTSGRRAQQPSSGRRSGRTQSGRGKETGLKLPAIGGASQYVPVKPIRPRKTARPRPAYAHFGTRKPQPPATKKPQPPPSDLFPMNDYYGEDGDLPWHLQPLAEVGLAVGLAPPPNQRLLTTMELHMVDIKNEERQKVATRKANMKASKQAERVVAQQQRENALAREEQLAIQQQAATLNAEMDAMDEEIRSPRPAAASTMGDVTFGSPKEIAAA